MVLIIGFGNPLMDCVFKIHNNDILIKHNLNADDSKEIPMEAMDNILADIDLMQCIWSPGGAIQNTLRILQWILGDDKSTIMFGTIGNDKNGTLLTELVNKSGVETRYSTSQNLPTGIIISLISNDKRSLVGNIGASEDYPEENILDPNNLSVLKRANIVCMEGFFLTNNRYKAARTILDFCAANEIKFIFNLSGKYLFETLSDEMIHFATNSLILFGNYIEFTELMKKMKKNYNSVKEFVLDLVKIEDKIVVITNGAKSIIYGYYPDNYIVYEIPTMDENDIVDTTGAGDSFIAGFLGCYLTNKDPQLCVKWGCWMAQKVIKEIGCKPPQCNVRQLYQIK